MKKYSLILSTHIAKNTRISVYELHKNGKSLFEPFVKEIEKDGNLFGHFARAIRIVEETSNLNRYPKQSSGSFKTMDWIVRFMKRNQV